MQAIDSESIKQVTNADLIVTGIPEEILQSKYMDGWCVVRNFRRKTDSHQIYYVQIIIRNDRDIALAEIKFSLFTIAFHKTGKLNIRNERHLSVYI
jgi:hypothetical protein